MEASDIIGDILDRLEDAQKMRFRAEHEAGEANGRAFRAEHEAARLKIEADDLRAALRKTETRLSDAVNLLTEEARARFEANVHPLSTGGDEIPF